MTLTIDFLRLLGSPFATKLSIHVGKTEINNLCQYALKNRMLFFFLDRLLNENVEEITFLHRMEYPKYERAYDAISETSCILTNRKIEHAVIKTIRPYSSTTVDIDILIFGSTSEYKKAILSLLNSKYLILGQGSHSTTLQHPTVDIKVDIYNEIAVSHIIYMDKQKLSTFHVTNELPNGSSVEMLAPEADLAIVVAHSIIKEQTYTLAEFYTFINYLQKINMEKFIKLVRECRITIPVQCHATITAKLHEKAFGIIPSPLQTILKDLQKTSLEEMRLVKSNFKMPHKYHPFTVIRSLFEISKEEKSRRSLVFQLVQMLRPSFFKQFTALLLDHLIRETY
jgi:hypothetical protein